MILLIVIVLGALTISGLCSILEASLLATSTLKLAQASEQGDRGARRLLHLKKHRIDDAISTILTWNTIAHTVGAALSGAQAARVFGDTWVGLFSGVLTLLILLFTEIIPKTVGTVYANSLAGFTGRTITLMMLPPMGWILYLTRLLTRLFAPHSKNSTTRSDVRAVLKLAATEGTLGLDEVKILSNLLDFTGIQVTDVMTPHTVITMFDRTAPLSLVLSSPTAVAFSRFPVFEGDRTNVVGYVLQRDLLRTLALNPSSDHTVEEHLRPLFTVDATLSVQMALKLLTERGEHLAIVLDPYGTPSGLVTLEDLFETALGIEIVDEFDQVVDLRHKAMELRDRRIERMRKRWAQNRG